MNRDSRKTRRTASRITGNESRSRPSLLIPGIWSWAQVLSLLKDATVHQNRPEGGALCSGFSVL